MKKTQLLDARRNIRKELVAFLSIVVIGLLASVAYLGITYSAAALKKDAVNFFNSQEFWDTEAVSTMLMTEEDLGAIRAVPGVREAEPVWLVDTSLHTGDSNTIVSVVSVPERIAMPVMLEGRLPETAEECAIEKKLADDCGLAVGQSFHIDCDTILETDPLLQHDFVITGVFHTPDHFSYMVPVTPYIYVTEGCFNREGLGDAFMKARIRVDGAPEDRYSDEYKSSVKPVTDALEDLGNERAPGRTAEVRSRLEESILDGQRQIDEAREQLRQAEEQIAEAEAAAADNIARMDEARAKLEELAQKLGVAPAELDAGLAQLNAAQQKLEAGKELLDEVKYWLDFGLDAIHTFYQIMVDTGKVPTAADIAKFKELAEQFGIDVSKLPDEMPPADEFLKWDPDVAIQWLKDHSGYSASEAEYRKKLQLYKDGLAAYELGRANYYYLGEEYLDGLLTYEKGMKELASAEARLQELYEARQQLEERKAELEAAQKRLDEAKKQLDAIGDCRWIVLDNNSNPGFVYGSANSEKLASLSMSFSSIFLVVGALVIYATISRMVEQQRRQIGVNKALGLFNREIFNKYLLFACSAVLLGVGLGVVLAWLPMQRAVLSSYEAHLNYGRGSNCFLPLQTALVVAGAFIVSLVAVYLGCTQLLRRTALALMQGATPASNSKKSSGSSSEKSLYFRLILRNMLSDRNRVLVTIISIAGGCVLMVVGFALRYGIMGVPDRQFGGIMTYDAEVYYDGKENADAAAEIETILNQNNLEHISVHRESGVFQAGDSLSSMTLVVAENGTLDGYFALKDIDSGNMLDVPDSGALVPRRFHEYYRIDVGGTVPAYDSGMNLCKLPVAGVFENYYGQLFFLSPQGYKESFKVAPEPNCFYVKTGGIPLSELQKKLEGVQGLTRVSDAAAERVMIGQFTSSLNFVVYLMLFIAGVMACFIVANFTMTYIQRKTGELTIMRINGFTSSECIRYLALDLVVTTVLGTALGLVLGGLMGARILRVTETPYIQMIREPRFESFLFAALITFAFSLLTNGFALRRIRKLKLTDINF